MTQKEIMKGIVLVGLGACFYGMLATFVKLAYKDGFTTAEVTTSQFVLGMIGMAFLNSIQSRFLSKKFEPLTASDKRKLMLAGTSMGTTSLFYYLAVQYINVSVAIVLLMQSVWISVLIEAVLSNKIPAVRKILAVILVLVGTLLATNLIGQKVEIAWKGIFWGFLAACSFFLTMFTSNRIATHASPTIRTLCMLSGGGVVVFLFLFFSQVGPMHFDALKELYAQFSNHTEGIRAFDFSIFWKYGIILSLFGTVLPPLFFNSGFPKAGLGLGGIVSALELPVSVMMAALVLHENIAPIQWAGISLILAAIILMNYPFKKQG